MMTHTTTSRLFDLVRKYDRPAPRYTSYPPAPHFDDRFSAEDFLFKLAGLRKRQTNVETGPIDVLHGHRGLSVYMHLPFCHSLCYYCGCHMLVTQRPDRVAEYLSYLRREIALAASHIGDANRIVQLHWGGGTPTYLTPMQISRLMGTVAEHFTFVPGAEVSLEADPRGLTSAHLQAAREAGFTRLSLGVQDLDPDVQQAINRVQSLALVEDVSATARRLGFESISFDLVYGLPHQTLDGFLHTIDEVCRLAPDRLSLFSYAHVPWKKKHQRMIREEWLPSPETKLRLFVEAANRLTKEHGYQYVGMDHFALPDDPLARALEDGTLQRNFQGYSTHGGTDLLGFGISSISQVEDTYAQNTLDLHSYYAAIDRNMPPIAKGYRLTLDDRIRGFVIRKLMCGLVLDVGDVERRFGIDFWTYFAPVLPELRDLEHDGLVELYPGALRVTEIGRFLVRNVAIAFDAYLVGRSPQRYSRAV